MSLLDRFDPVFMECLGCLCPPPYPTALCVEQTIDEAIIKAKVFADELQATDGTGFTGNNDSG